MGFRNKDLVILEKEFEAVSNRVVKMSDDGTWGEKGLVTNALEAVSYTHLDVYKRQTCLPPIFHGVIPFRTISFGSWQSFLESTIAKISSYKDYKY